MLNINDFVRWVLIYLTSGHFCGTKFNSIKSRTCHEMLGIISDKKNHTPKSNLTSGKIETTVWRKYQMLWLKFSLENTHIGRFRKWPTYQRELCIWSEWMSQLQFHKHVSIADVFNAPSHINVEAAYIFEQLLCSLHCAAHIEPGHRFLNDVLFQIPVRSKSFLITVSWTLPDANNWLKVYPCCPNKVHAVLWQMRTWMLFSRTWIILGFLEYHVAKCSWPMK